MRDCPGSNSRGARAEIFGRGVAKFELIVLEGCWFEEKNQDELKGGFGDGEKKRWIKFRTMGKGSNNNKGWNGIKKGHRRRNRQGVGEVLKKAETR